MSHKGALVETYGERMPYSANTMSKNLDILRSVGIVAFGVWWQTPMAEAIGIHRRTVHRWIQEEFDVPDTIDGHELLDVLNDILTKHEKECRAVRVKLDRLMK